jgi:hypothetical protein
MSDTNQKTSLLVRSQLPEFVRDNPDYDNFVTFVQAYYEWMEQNNGVTYGSKNLLSYHDIDKTTSQFMEYFINDFLPYFPQDALVDKSLAIKVARQLYQTKGTPASYQFLFKTLYNSEFNLFYTKDSVLRASAGSWYVSKSLRLATTDTNFLNISRYRLFGESTKSIATVENALSTNDKIEVFISNIERLFNSGEFVRVVDNNNQDVYFLDGNVVPSGTPGSEILRAKIVGQISQINIDPNNRGLFYQPGDPVVVYGGLNSNTGIGATATVGTTTKGSIKRINVLTGGYGYTANPNTYITITDGGGASAVVGSLDPDPTKTMNVSFVVADSIRFDQSGQGPAISNTTYSFLANTISNVDTPLQDAFGFDSFQTYPISSVLVTNGGGGITKVPGVTAISSYIHSSLGNPDLKSLGILAPIQITSGGEGYQANDTIVFTGGSGYGAYANVETVDADGQILTISYVAGEESYTIGGMGYRTDALPAVSVNSANVQASGASIYVPGILGDGATFSAVTDRAGSITTISISNYGEDYIETPNVSIKIQDVVVYGIDITNFPQKSDTIYQGADVGNSSYLAYVDSVQLIQPNIDPALSLYNLRVYNYNSNPNLSLPIKFDGKDITLTMANHPIHNYGDGTAKASATFLNGLTIGSGQYLNTQGQPSSFDVLQSKKYNNYTYLITVTEEISKYRDILLNLLHPTGMQMLGRYALKSEARFNNYAFSVE